MAKISLDYATLTPHERFALMIEAMARRDDVEADRLADTCPRFTYRAEDAQFRDRMRRAYHIASTVCLNMRAGLARIRLAQTFRELTPQFSSASVTLARTAFLYGREYRKWEVGEIETIDLPDAEALAREVEADDGLRHQLTDLEELGGEAVRTIAEILHHAVGRADEVDLLSQWEGFARFYRRALNVEPLVIAKAFGLLRDDPSLELRSAFPNVIADEAAAGTCAMQWETSWTRRFDPT